MIWLLPDEMIDTRFPRQIFRGAAFAILPSVEQNSLDCESFSTALQLRNSLNRALHERQWITGTWL